MAQVDLLLDQQVVRIPLAAFLVPRPEQGPPFVVLGQEPLFVRAEVRFRSWEGRLGIRDVSAARMRSGWWTGGSYGPAVQPPDRRRIERHSGRSIP